MKKIFFLVIGILFLLAVPVSAAPNVTGIPDQTIFVGESFATINLDDYVTDPTYNDSQQSWTYAGNVEFIVSINASRVATITPPNATWTGSENITFSATDPMLGMDGDTALFTVTINPYNVTSCQVLNLTGGTYLLKNNVTASGTCFDVEADGITIDCQDYYVFLDNDSEIGFDVDGYDSLTMNNCHFYSTANSVSGVRGGDSSNSNVYTFSNGSAYLYGSSGLGTVFFIDRGSGTYTIQDSVFNVSSAYVFHGEETTGTKNLYFYRNNVTFNSHQAVVLEDNEWRDNQYINNSIIATSDNLIGIYGAVSGRCIRGGDTLLNNYIYARSAYSVCHNGLTIGTMKNNIFDGTPASSPSHLIQGAANFFGSFVGSWNNNTLINASGNWIYNHPSGYSGSSLMTNTIFQTQYGTIFIPSFTFVTEEISQAILTISDDNVFINSTLYPNLDVPATLTINSPKFSDDNYPHVDEGDTGIFEYCDDCNVISHTTPFVFTVPGFTSYSSGIQPPIKAICEEGELTMGDAASLAGLILIIILVGTVLATLVMSFTGMINIQKLGSELSLDKLPGAIMIIGITFLILATMSLILGPTICGSFGG